MQDRSLTPYRKLDDKAPSQSLVRKTNAEQGVIELPLPQELTQQFSSGNYAEVLETMLSPGDFAYTYGFRYPGVVEGVLSNSSCVGPVLEFSHANPVFAMVFTIMLASYSAYQAGAAYRAQEAKRKEVRERYQASYSKITDSLERKPITSLTVDQSPKMDPYLFIANVNEQLRYVVAKSAGEIKKMELVFDEYQNVKVRCSLAEIEKKQTSADKLTAESKFDQWVAWLNKSRLGRAWSNVQTTLGLAAFSYWILWIGAAVFTGTLAVGVVGLPFWGLAFAIPAVLALPYLGLKLYHWVKNDGASVSDEYAKHKKSAENEMSDLLYKALREVEYQDQLTALQEEIRELKGGSTKAPVSPELMVDSKKGSVKTGLTVAATFTTAMFESYGFTQYKLWLTTDLLVKTAVIAAAAIPLGPFVGLPLLVGYLLYSAYAARKQYKEIQKENDQPHQGKQLVKVEDLSGILSEKLGRLDAYKLKIQESGGKLQGELENAIEVPSLKKPTVYDFFNRKMTGIFFGRLFVTGAALAIPFAVVTTLFPPVTLGIIALSGLVYAGFKLFLDYQQSKKSYAEQMLTCIDKADKQQQLAELTDQVLTLRQAKKKETLSNEYDVSQSSLFSDEPSAGPSPVYSEPVWSLRTPSRTPSPPIMLSGEEVGLRLQ